MVGDRVLQTTKMKRLYDGREGGGAVCRIRGRLMVIDSSTMGRREPNENQAQLGYGSKRVTMVCGVGEDGCSNPSRVVITMVNVKSGRGDRERRERCSKLGICLS